MNVKALCDTKEYRLWCKSFNKPKSLNDLGELIVPNLFHDSSIVNTSFDILIRLILYTRASKFVWHDSLRNAVANYKNVFKKELKKDLGFNRTEELDIEDLLVNDIEYLFDVCLRLAICENFMRSLCTPQSLKDVINDFDVAKIELHWMYTDFAIPDFGKYLASPALRHAHIYGEPDILTSDCIWDFKCSAIDNLKRDTFNQQVTYLLLARTMGSNVDRLGFIFPRFDKNIVIHSDEIFPEGIEKKTIEFKAYFASSS